MDGILSQAKKFIIENFPKLKKITLADAENVYLEGFQKGLETLIRPNNKWLKATKESLNEAYFYLEPKEGTRLEAGFTKGYDPELAQHQIGEAVDGIDGEYYGTQELCAKYLKVLRENESLKEQLQATHLTTKEQL